LDPERIQYQKSFLRCPAMKVRRHLPRQSRGAAVAGPVRNYKADAVSQGLDLPVNRIHPITPPAMQEHHRLSATHIPVVNPNRPNPRRMWRVFQFHKWHVRSKDSAVELRASDIRVGTAAPGCPAGRSPAESAIFVTTADQLTAAAAASP